MNRHDRRRQDAIQRHVHPDDQLIIGTDRGQLLALVAALAETDETVSGATLITATGEVEYFDAGLLRQGGRA